MNMNLIERVELIKDKPEIVVGIMDMVVGDYIGSGTFRDVYQHNINKDYVVKLQREEHNSNVIEFEIWCNVSETPYAKWFAPVRWISDNGKVLFQEKVEPITEKNQHLIPDNIPYFFTDLKPSNFGFIKKQLVCVDYDYSLIRFIDNGLTKRTRNSKELKL